MPDVAAATAKFEASNKNDLAILRQDTVPGIGRVILQLRRTLQEIRGNVRNSIQAMTNDTAAARAKAQASLDTLQATATIAISNIRADIAKQTAVKLDPQEQLIREMQLAGARRRLDMLTANGVDTAQVIARASANGDALMLSALREDLPLFAGTSHADAARLESLMDQLDLAEVPLMSATQQAARILLDELKYGQMNLTTSFQLARGEAGGASQTAGGNLVGTVTTIADWGRGMPYRIDEKNPDGCNTSPPTPIQESRGAFQDDPQIAAGDRARAAALAASEAAFRAGRPNVDGQ